MAKKLYLTLLSLYMISVPLEGVLDSYNVSWIGEIIVSLMLTQIVAKYFKKDFFKISIFESAIYLLIVWSALTITWSVNVKFSINSYLIQIYLVIPVLFVVINKYKSLNIKYVIIVYLLSLSVTSLFSLYQYFILKNIYFAGRLTVSEFYNPSWFAALLGLGVITAFIYIKIERKIIYRTFGIILIGLFIIALMLTQGRTAIVALFGSCLFYLTRLDYRTHINKFLLHLKITKKFTLTIIVFASSILVVISIYVYILNNYPHLVNIQRYLNLFSGDTAVATANRIPIWQNYFKILELSPNLIVGHGIWTSPLLYISNYGIYEPPHNGFISVLIELGLIGLLIYFFFYFSLLFKVNRGKKVNFRGAQVILIYAFLLNFGNDMITYKYFWILIVWTNLFIKFDTIENSNNNITRYERK